MVKTKFVMLLKKTLVDYLKAAFIYGVQVNEQALGMSIVFGLPFLTGKQRVKDPRL